MPYSFYMKVRFDIYILLFLSSCALFDKYDLNQHSAYHRSLTIVEREEINSKGRIVKQWKGTNSLGDYEEGDLLIINSTNNTYKFIQIGHWESSHNLTRGNKNLGTLKQIMDFDSLGNLRSRESYLKPQEANNFYLAEKLTSTINQENKLVQFSERMDADKRKMYHIHFRYMNYQFMDNDRLKKKEIVEIKYFDKEGNEVPEYRDQEIDGIVRIVRMKNSAS